MTSDVVMLFLIWVTDNRLASLVSLTRPWKWVAVAMTTLVTSVLTIKSNLRVFGYEDLHPSCIP